MTLLRGTCRNRERQNSSSGCDCAFTLPRILACGVMSLMISSCCLWSRCPDKSGPRPEVLSFAACADTSHNYGQTNSVRRYKINTSSIQTAIDEIDDYVVRKSDGGVSEVTGEDLEQAIVLAADTWNEQSNAGFFRYMGSTVVVAPWFALECDEKGVDYSTVFVNRSKSDSGGGPSCYRRGTAEQFRVGIGGLKDMECRPDCGGFLGPSMEQYDDPSDKKRDRYDFVKTVMHELGHTFDIAGHETPTSAVMEGGKAKVNRSRDLYQRDIECLWLVAGNRRVRAYRAYQLEDGTFFGPELVSREVQKASAGARYKANGKFAFTTTVIRDGTWLWGEENRGMRIIGSPGMFDPRIGIGIRQVVFREAPEIQRIFYSSWREYPVSYRWDAKHRVEYVAFHADDPGKISTGPLYRCSEMTSEMWCDEEKREPVYSGKAIAAAFDESSERTVFAWVNQNRLSNKQSRQIRISVGYISDDLLPEPDELDIQSNVTPGLACSDTAADGYNCILAYVDAAFDDGQVRVRRFSTEWEGKRYHVRLDSKSHVATGVKTGSSIAAWFSPGGRRFYLAFRSSKKKQHLKIATSDDGIGWSRLENALKASDWRYTITGPTVVSYADPDPETTIGNHGMIENAIVWISER